MEAEKGKKVAGQTRKLPGSRGSNSELVRQPLTGKAGAVEGEAVEGAEDGDGDLVGLEILAGQGLEFFAGYGFDAGQDFVKRIKPAEVQFLAREIGHARTGGLQREHQRTLQVILRPAKFFFRDRRFLQRAKFLNCEIDHLADGIRSGASVDGHHACIRVRRELAKHRIGKALLLANILEQARRHAPTQKIVEDGDAKAVLVSERNRRDADAEMDL